MICVYFEDSDNQIKYINDRHKLIASSQVELKFFWKSIKSNWEVELKHLSRVKKLDSIIWLENSTWLDKILDKCK